MLKENIIFAKTLKNESVKTIDIQLEYSAYEQDDLEPIIFQIESRLNAQRKLYGSRAGATDLVMYMGLALTFTGGVVVSTILGKYFEGLFRGDKAKALGEKHHKAITQWLANLKVDLQKTLRRLAQTLRNPPVHLGYGDKEQAFAITFIVNRTNCFVVLDYAEMNEALLENLPSGIVSMIDYLAVGNVPEDSQCAQLYFNRETARWAYIFLPTTKGYGKWIDRYYDIDAETLYMVKSKEEFKTKFKPIPRDELRFLVNPFRFD